MSSLNMFTMTALGQKLVQWLENCWQTGSLDLGLPNGSRYYLQGRMAGPHGVVNILDWRVARRVFRQGGLGLARGYIAGEWTSPELSRVIELLSRNRLALSPLAKGGRLARLLAWLHHRRRDNSRAGAERNIAYHYDMGNAFYESWLDPSMTYSSAVFAPGDNSLEAAQLRKYRRLLDQLDVKPGDHILEIGSGWGGFAELAARERGVLVTGVTLSRQQLLYAQQRIAKAGLTERVEFALRDYRDIDGRYDHVASIEMFEAVGEKYWPGFFTKLYDVLKPGGRAALQVITIEDSLFDSYRRTADFIQTYIFPGGMLPSPKIFRELAAKAGLQLSKEARFGVHYAQTLRLWREAFERAWSQRLLPPGFDEKFRRFWTYYLAYCEGGFRGGSIDVAQTTFIRP